MGWRKTLKLVFLIEIGVLLALYFLFGSVLARPIPTATMLLGGVKAEFPAGEYQPVSSQEWEGFRFAFGFRLFSRPSSEAEKEFAGLMANGFPGQGRLRLPVSLFDQGLYVFNRRHKGYVLTAVWRQGDRWYWADIVSFSTLDGSLNFFHRFLKSVEIGGRAAGERLGRELASIRSRLTPLNVQSPAELVLMIGAIMLLVWLLIYPLMKWSGAAPRNEADFEFCTPQATLVVRGLGRRSSPCCVCKRGNSLLVYKFRRQVLEIRLPDEREHLSVKKRSLVYKNQRLIPDNEDDFQRWLTAASLSLVQGNNF